MTVRGKRLFIISALRFLAVTAYVLLEVTASLFGT